MSILTQQAAVVKKWEPVLVKCKDVGEEMYPLLAQTLENQFLHHQATASILGEDAHQALEDFTRFSMPIVRNTVPFLGVYSLVGVQSAVNGLVLRRHPDRAEINASEFTHRNTVKLDPSEAGIDDNTPDADRKLTTIISNQLIRHIDNFVIDELFEAATKYDDVLRAIAETTATWVVASRDTIDKHPVFREVKDKRGGHAFDDIYEGGYRSDIRPDGTFFGAQVYVHAELEDGRVLVGCYDDDFTSNYILSIGTLLLRSPNANEDELSPAELDMLSGKNVGIMSALGSHKFDMAKYGCVELT